MSRLIDGIRLRTEIDLLHARKKITPNTMLVMKRLIDNQPTACDLDNLVEQLEHYRDIMKENMNTAGNTDNWNYYRGRWNTANDAIEIVKAFKGGGMNDSGR